jgi:hypothetical protein
MTCPVRVTRRNPLLLRPIKPIKLYSRPPARPPDFDIPEQGTGIFQMTEQYVDLRVRAEG